MTDDLESRIDALYSGPPDRFIPERDALAKELRAAGDAQGASRVKALRKPVASAWGLNLLAREEPDAVGELVRLGDRLRSAQRRALSGAGVDELREAMEERRRLVAELEGRAAAALERRGVPAASHADDLRSSLEAAAADAEAGELVRSGRLTKPLRPPAAFGEGGLTVLEGGRTAPGPRTGARAKQPQAEQAAAARSERRELERELSAAERRERVAAETLERARRRLEAIDAKRAEARDAIRAAEADLRGATLERKRVSMRLDRLG